MTLTELMKFKRDQRKQVAKAKSPAAPSGKNPNEPEDEAPYKPLEWPVVRRVLGLMSMHKWGYVLALALNIVMVFFEMLGPTFTRHLIDSDIPGKPHFLAGMIEWILHLFSARAAEWFAGRVAESPSYWGIGLTVGFWAFLQLILLILWRFNLEFNRRIGEEVIFSLRRKVFDHLQKLSMSFYDKTKFGRILSRGTTDLDAMVNPIVNGINAVVLNILQMTAAATILFITDWRLGLSVCWLGPVLFLMNRKYKRMIGAKWRIVREGFTRVSTNLAENINGMRVVTAYNRQEENLSAFNTLQMANTNNNLEAATINGIYQPLLVVVGYIGRVIILVYGCYLLMWSSVDTAHPLTVGALVATLMYWEWFMNPVLNFGNFHNEMMASMASAERVFSLLDQKPDVQDAEKAMTLPPIQGAVKFEHVNFEYVSGKPVLHDINFEAKPGQTIALVGHTGCGKSTIMNLICRFYLPQSGVITIDGYDIRTITGESLHQQMGIVSQANYLFSGTVLDNIRYARPQATLDDVIKAAEQLGSHDILMNLKDGYNSEVGERGASMSLGQRQLICFTRAFLANPRILMLDEATSAVDTHTELLIQQALERLVAQRTTFIVAHRLSTVVNANLVLVLDHGKIIERGTHHELLDLNGKYAELYKQFTREI